MLRCTIFYSSFFILLHKVLSRSMCILRHLNIFYDLVKLSLIIYKYSVCRRSRGPVDFVHRRVWRRQDREYEESDSIFGLRGRVETQVQRGKSTSISTFVVVVRRRRRRRRRNPLCFTHALARRRHARSRALDKLNHREPFIQAI